MGWGFTGSDLFNVFSLKHWLRPCKQSACRSYVCFVSALHSFSRKKSLILASCCRCYNIKSYRSTDPLLGPLCPNAHLIAYLSGSINIWIRNLQKDGIYTVESKQVGCPLEGRPTGLAICTHTIPHNVHALSMLRAAKGEQCLYTRTGAKLQMQWMWRGQR